MPVSITTAVVGAIVATEVGTGLVGAIAGAVAAASVAFVGSKLLYKPKKLSGAFGEQGALVAQRNPIAPQLLVYGEARVGGTYVFMASTSASGSNQPNRLLYLVIALAGHEVEAIGDIYFDDVLVPLQASGAGYVPSSGRYAGTHPGTGEPWVYVEKYTGAADQQASSLLVGAGLGWTREHRGRGIAYLMLRLVNSSDIWPSGLPGISAVVKGKKVYDPRTGQTAWSDNWALCLADYLTNAKFGIRETYASRIDEDFLIAAANVSDEIVAVTTENLSGTSDGATLDVSLTAERTPRIGERYTISGNTYYCASVAGANPTTEGTRRFRLTFATSLSNARAGTTTSIPTGSVTATRTGEPRYTCNGVISADRPRREVLDELRQAGAGAVVHAGGKWRILAGAWRAPTVTLTASDLRGPIRFNTKLSARDGGNGVRGVFADPSHLWQPTDYPAVTNAAYVEADNGIENWRDLDLPFTASSSMAQRIAKITLERLRRPINGVFPCKLSAWRVVAGDVIHLSLDRYGWSPKAFEVETSRLVFDEDENGNPFLGVDLTLRELDANAFAWSENDEAPLPAAPATTLPNPFAPSPPSGLTLASGTDQLFVAGDGTVVSRIRVSWAPSNDGFNDQTEIGWKRSSESVWQSVIVPGETAQYFISPVEDGAVYDVRVRAITTLGVRSAYATFTGHRVVGKTALPPTPIGFAVTAQADGTRRFSWNAVPDADVRAGGGYRIRYHASESDWEDMTPLHQGVITASPFETNELQAGTYNFGLKAVDSSGNESATAAFISGVVLPNPRLANAIYSVDERAEGWPGTKTNCFVTPDGILVALSEIDSLAETIGELEDAIRDLGEPVADPIEYETLTIDLGADVRVTPIVNAIGSGSATVTMQTGTAADGAPTGSFVALAAVTARYLKIRVSMPGTDPYIEALQIILDAPSQTEVYEDLSTATSSTYLNRIAEGHFEVGSRGLIAAISTARIVAIQNVGPGYTWELISKSGTLNGKPAATFKLYDGTGSLADAVVDVELKGPKA